MRTGSAAVLALALAAPTAEAGRRGFPAKKVKSFDVALDGGPALPGTVVPGQPSPLQLTIADKRGRTLSTADGSLVSTTRRIEVLVEGGQYDPHSGTLIADRPDPRQARTATLTVTARYAKRPDLDVVRSWPIDWRAVLGPDPQEVTGLTVTPVSSEIVDDWLLPGAEVGLDVAATDTHGRTYRTGPGQRIGLPWARLSAQSEGMLPQPQEGLLRAKPDVPRDSRYTVSVAYEGSPHTADASWAPDYQRLLGPEPDEVAALTWSVSLPDSSPAGQAPLRAQLPVQVTVDTTNGRTFQLRTAGKMRLVADRLRLDTRRSTWDAQRLLLVVDDRIGAGQGFGMQVAYEGRADLASRQAFQVDYLGSIPKELFVGGGTVHAIEGGYGDPGRAGVTGRDGREGRASTDPQSVADRGTNGQAGSHGEDGRPGGDGGVLRVRAASAWTLDGAHQLVVYELGTGDGRRSVLVKPWREPAIDLVSRGGPGGSGGAGGDGGDGGPGGDGCLTGDGGDGADAGDGGNGGPGGRGGDVQLTASSAALFDHFRVSAPGGRGGSGGPGGSGGQGGIAPSSTSPPTEYDSEGNALPSPSCESGRNGLDGRDGRTGQPGYDGPPGRTDTRVTPTVGDRMALPDELDAAVILR